MPAILENVLIMILTIVVVVAGGYLMLVLLGWWLKIKTGGREEQGLTDLWIANQPKPQKSKSDTTPSDENS
jgi:hypothetical protein